MQTARLNGDESLPTPSTEDARRQLERIQSSDEFHAPDRGRKFLEYIVEETLAGRRDYLKAYTIAQEVFARDSSFDAQNDPVVRIEAGRIRRALERYYLVAGQHDPVVITIPKGGYVPCFKYAEHAPASPFLHEGSDGIQTMPGSDSVEAPHQLPSAGGAETKPAQNPRLWYAITAALALALLISILWEPFLSLVTTRPSPPSTGATAVEADLPKIVVDVFEDVSGNQQSATIARGLTDEVITQLAKFKEVVVITQSPARFPEETAPADRDLPRFALQGGVRVEGDRLRLIARLVSRSDGSVVWANDYDRNLGIQNVLEIEADVAQRIATTLAQPYGIIFQADHARMVQAPGEDWEAYACTLSYYGYRTDLDPKSHAAVLDCLKHATARLPKHATLWALLSLTYVDEIRFSYRLDTPPSAEPLALAMEAAQRAVDLEPENTRALEALMLANFFGGDIDTALRLGATAYAVNPNDTEVAGEYGFRLALSGKWETGCELLSSAIARNPGPRGYYEVGMAVCAYMRGDNRAAELWIQMADLRYNPMHHLVLIAILGAEGRLDEARKEQEWLKANAPDLLPNIRKEVVTRLRRGEDQERFFAGLRSAGIVIPPP
ncbi:hypothetical protein [Rhizobium sp. BK251]|uniref:hypothetical protein n=1 Tax=Rhizobium sp. BK251 TaxID=2512125 RepID=UPI00104CF247|nr:hypothetical protein [Rhizobium sp. BK251]TCL65235.1 TolB-like protein [Rhizobium sp. BK251]